VEYWSYPQLKDGQVLGAVVAFVDITARKRAEEEQARLQAQLNQAQKMESLGSLAGGIAHDMNNVLGAILGLASANVERQPMGSPSRQAFETIIKAAERGGKMVQGLLGFARRTTAEERELNLNELIQEQVHLLERTTLSKIRIEMDLAKDLHPILGDSNTLTHALMNLCVNAVDAMPENGTLILRTRNAGRDVVEVHVEDNGTGMPKEVVERATDPFFTTKEQGKGTGLGLSLVYSAMKAHRGELEIQSEPGQGTCVKLRFPACEPGPLHFEAVESPIAGAPRNGLEVLVIDDDELIQTSLRMLLEALGHTVTSTLNGEEALARLKAGCRADLVILDMNMPGLGGAGTLPQLRTLRPEVPVLLATGRSTQTALDLVEADPNTTLLSKPFTMDELRIKIEAVLKPG
jgi:nitrogen-specific signal transduction histidine kinase